MEIWRKIASKYLKNQYKLARKYLEKEAQNSKELEVACERVRRAGKAYAQTEYCVFIKNGIYGECRKQIIYPKIGLCMSLYDEFINEMEIYIQQYSEQNKLSDK